jgi:hypothetical protein
MRLVAVSFFRAALTGSASRIAEARAPRFPKGCVSKHEDGGACLMFRSAQLDLNEFATTSSLRRSAVEPER